MIDQLTKLVALHYLSPQHSLSVVPSILDFTLVRNPGIAFGLLSGQRSFLFTVITVSLAFLFFITNRSHHEARVWDRLALSLILGGAIGNWIDRFRFGTVIDFIDFRVWPVFNVADSAITIGVCIYLLGLFTSSGKKMPPSL